jgi:hypothetical protein
MCNCNNQEIEKNSDKKILEIFKSRNRFELNKLRVDAVQTWLNIQNSDISNDITTIFTNLRNRTIIRVEFIYQM